MHDRTDFSHRRCAIYTRKSTNRLLEHEVNSLVTQREICAAYVRSQGYRGWFELPETYDDGGHSGSGLERPALARLMTDVEDGLVDTVIVYKIDRLTRSLFDFVRLIEVFDRRSVSLVSVSQAFDTADSMGRMILNVLLTFSQFERELIAERVRDSIRTRKRHGKVHGGLPPFGYVATPKGLVVDAHEAGIVRFAFAEFLRTRRYTAVMKAVRDAGMCSSVKYSSRGVPRGGRAMSPGTVYGILRNPIYVGEIRGHDRNYAGEHEALIDRATWDAAQAIGDERRKRPPGAKDTHHFLAGLLWDELGRHMLLDLNWHRGKTYCAYASSNAMWSQKEYRRAYRANADELEKLVVASTCDFLSDRGRLRKALKGLGLHGDDLEGLGGRGAQAADRLAATSPPKLRDVFAAIVHRIEIGEEELVLTFRTVELRRYLEWTGSAPFHGRPGDWALSDARHDHVVAVRAIAAERWPSLHISPRDMSGIRRPDPKLVDLVRSARKAQRLVEENRDLSLDELASRQGCRSTHFARLVRLNYLAPDIVTAIFDGTQPEGLTRKDVLMSNVPTDWAVQRRLYGFPPPVRAIEPRNLFGRGMWPSAREVGS